MISSFFLKRNIKDQQESSITINKWENHGITIDNHQSSHSNHSNWGAVCFAGRPCTRDFRDGCIWTTTSAACRRWGSSNRWGDISCYPCYPCWIWCVFYVWLDGLMDFDWFWWMDFDWFWWLLIDCASKLLVETTQEVSWARKSSNL